MLVEVRRRKERQGCIGQGRVLLKLGVDLEHDDIGIPFARLGVDGVGTRGAEEEEAAAAHLVDGRREPSASLRD